MIPKLFFFLFCLIITIPSSSVEAYLARRGCNDNCGGLAIPFPFGMGQGCYLNDWYSIECREAPYLTRLNLKVLNITLPNRIVTINTPGFSSSQISGFSTNGINLTSSPFFVDKDDNRLMLFGCGNSLLLHQNDATNILSGCMSLCTGSNREVSSCFGINCCETSLPYFLRGYQLNVTRSNNNNNGRFTNISTFVVDEKWRPVPSYENPFGGAQNFSVPLKLTWTIQRSDLSVISSCGPENYFIEVEQDVDIEAWSCPCRNNLQYENTDLNPYLDGQCNVYSRKWTAAIVGATSSAGVLFLVVASFISYKLCKRRRDRKLKERFFKRNGGLLLQNQLSSNDRVIDKTRVFTARELEKATDNFSDSRILGRGGQGTVYKGMLHDGRIVAIKKSKLVDESQLELFINEVVLLSQVVHKNVVKLLGCCLETEVPLLVYEFISNGTLLDLIHNRGSEFLAWNFRLRIATEVAGALAYLHSAISTPIYHRDIKSSNILLDERYTAIVSDFGTSRPISIDKTHVTTLVKGTFGYLDPEYFQSSQFTEKSDVYSFGVVLVELLTRQKAVLSYGTGEDGYLSLATLFLDSVEENCLVTILDDQILDQTNKEEVVAVANLAYLCLNLNGKKRPNMTEVAAELQRIRTLTMDPSIQVRFQSFGCRKEDPIEFSDAFSACTDVSTK